jgi:hypothetical protein
MKSIIVALLFLSLMAAPLMAESPDKSVYLVVMNMTNTGNASFNFNYHVVSDMDTCLKIVDRAKIAIPRGGDAEAAIAFYCAPSKAKIWSSDEILAR